MAIIDLEDKLVEIVNRGDHSNFVYELLDLYDIPRATITRLKSGNQNLASGSDEVHLKNKMWYKQAKKGKLFESFVEIEQQVADLSAKPRYMVVTDFNGLLAKDTRTQEALDIEFRDLPKYFDFFLAWKGIEKVDYEKENPADIKAAERFARLFDVLRKDNNIADNNKGLDLFLIRLLFCLFAEDTGIFDRNCFTNAIKTLTEEDGSDLNQFFEDLFKILDQKERHEVPTYLKGFPYVNGQLFTEPHQPITFSTRSRKLIVECGELLDWTKINPDIFGSMIQAVATEDSRSHLGMHYTSVPNIMKVIKPLFLDELYEAFEKAYDSMDKLAQLYNRIGEMKFFDPACGSGNFLIITYKELRRLEIRILLRQVELSPTIMYLPSVTLDQFYGIEIDDFASHVAKLSLWIAEHQMNVELEKSFYKVRPTLPLQAVGDIRCANALRVDWNEICPINKEEEVYVFGNPPYLGSRNQEAAQKRDMELLFDDTNAYKKLDYIACWFVLAANYINNNNAKFAFVSTNSLFQGEQVPLLWEKLSSFHIEISFAYSSFKWDNNAKNNAGVIVVIVGFATKGFKNQKKLYTSNNVMNVDNINAYLTSGPNVIVKSNSRQLHNYPKLNKGNAAYDDGKFTISLEEYNQLSANYPEVLPYLRKYISAEDFINGTYKYCLWLTKENVDKAVKIPFIKTRIDEVRAYRLKSKRAVTVKQAEKPYAFGEVRYENKPAVIIPVVSSEIRDYIPMGIVHPEIIPSYATFTIYDAQLWLLGLLQSKMHMAWVKAVAGRLKTDYRYSAGLCYNTFPFPDLSLRKKKEIEEAMLNILDIREEHGGTLAELYHPKLMPRDLKTAHEHLDGIIERTYRLKPFESDEERLELLLEKYQNLTERQV